MKDLSVNRLRELLSYDAETGLFTRRIAVGKVKAGTVAGGVNPDGYMMIGVDGQLYRAHRLAWLYVYGRWPKGDTDHINRVRSDNRFANLREVSRGENMSNRVDPLSNNSSGFFGVSYCIKTKKWRAQISSNRRRFWLGRHDTAESAHAAYMNAKRMLHPCAFSASDADSSGAVPAGEHAAERERGTQA